MRNILAVIIGVIIGVFFIALGEFILSVLIPSLNIPKQLDLDHIQSSIDQIPFIGKLGIVINWGISGFIGATCTTFIQGRTHYKPMLVTIGILQLLTYMNLMIGWVHPIWMWVCATFIYVFVGFTSYYLIRKKHV